MSIEKRLEKIEENLKEQLNVNFSISEELSQTRLEVSLLRGELKTIYLTLNNKLIELKNYM